MFKHFQNYYWKNGKPYGSHPIDPADTQVSYKIIVDPYYKRFTIEKYHFIYFNSIVYDSSLLDFRTLTLKDQLAWRRETIREDKDLTLCLLRNHEDRAILIEEISFEQLRCRMCITRSIHHIQLATHKMYYKSLNDAFNGVVLFDSEKRPVMMKIYELDSETDEFTDLLKEEWDLTDKKIQDLNVPTLE